MVPKIEFHGVSKRFAGSDANAVNDLSFRVEEGAFVAIVGTSGSGKTTALKLVNGLCRPDSGGVFIDGRDMAAEDPVLLRRTIGYAIQEVGLFPHMTVRKNIATVPRILKWPRARIDARVDELLALVNLDAETYRDRRPSQLSGGQRQRVGLARALAADPDILLMDEPFGAVDAINRAALQDELLRIHRASGKTILFVTHDVDEALKLGTAILILDAGRLQQYASPPDILARPANAFVASLLKGATDPARCGAGRMERA